MPRIFEVAPGPHARQLAIQAHDLSVEECRLLRSIVTNNWMPSDDYKFGHEAGVFLQGYEPEHGWALVEFWTSDREAISAFVVHVNRRFAEPNALADFAD